MPPRAAYLILAVAALIAAAKPLLAQDHGHMAGAGVDSGEIKQGGTWEHEFGQPGEFDYHCHPHPFMTGRIRVSEGAAATGVVDVRITGYAFEPANLTVAPGTTVRWTNQDPVNHTVTQEAEQTSGAFGLPWWQVGLGAGAVALAVVLILVKDRQSKPPKHP